jgi:hypothetical protein
LDTRSGTHRAPQEICNHPCNCDRCQQCSILLHIASKSCRLINVSVTSAIPHDSLSVVHIQLSLTGSDSSPHSSTTLPRVQSCAVPSSSYLGSLLDFLIGFGENKFNVAGVRHVGVDLYIISTSPKRDSKISYLYLHDREHDMYDGAAWVLG